MVNNERGTGSARQNEYSQRQTASFRMKYSSIIIFKNNKINYNKNVIK